MKAKLLTRQAYGLDQSGEVLDNQQKNVEDTSEPQDQHQTQHNSVNLSSDVQAEKDFPGLGHQTTRFPTRHD